MKERYSNNDYSKYTFEDFLQDDYFISSVKNHNECSDLFWAEQIKENKINIEEFYSAKSFIQSIGTSYDKSITQTELSTLWDNITTSNKKYRPKKHLRNLLFIGSSVAAIIIFIFIAMPYFTKTKPTQGNDIMSFVRDNQKINSGGSETQIILSDNKIVQLDEKESEIVYDSTEIKISQKGISKKELSAFNQLVVPKGKRSKLTLIDGTKMHVNAGTRVVYPIEFVGDKREIYVDGEIFINVAHDISRPFIVKTKDIDIQVLGTKFNVMAYENDANKQIVLANGSVKITSKAQNKEAILKPSQMYDYNNGEGIIENIDISKYTSWVNGLYIFDSERLYIVLLRLSRYYDAEISCNKDIASLKCSGKMDLKYDLNDILKGLAFSFPINVQYESNKYNITKN